MLKLFHEHAMFIKGSAMNGFSCASMAMQICMVCEVHGKGGMGTADLYFSNNHWESEKPWHFWNFSISECMYIPVITLTDAHIG